MIMNPRRTALAAIGASCTAALLVGCSSATGGAGAQAGSTPGLASGSATSGSTASGSTASGLGTAATPSSAASAGARVSSAALATRMRAGIESVSSAHLSMSIGVGGEAITATGDQKLERGALQSAMLDETIPQFGDLTILIVGKTVYVKLPPKAATGDKPWFRVTASSSNPFVRTLASTLDSIIGSASLQSFAAFAAAAKNITVAGTDNVNGAPATRYSLTIDVAKLPADFPNRAALQKTGLATLPITLWLDAKDRVVKVAEKVTVQGTTATTEVLLSDFDKPVTITPPPAGQISD